MLKKSGVSMILVSGKRWDFRIVCAGVQAVFYKGELPASAVRFSANMITAGQASNACPLFQPR